MSVGTIEQKVTAHWVGEVGEIEQLTTSKFVGTGDSLSGPTCPTCFGWVTNGTAHQCPVNMPQLPSSWSPTNYDPLILAELQAIRLLLEKLVAKAGGE